MNSPASASIKGTAAPRKGAVSFLLGFVLVGLGLFIQTLLMGGVVWFVGVLTVLLGSIVMMPRGASNAPSMVARRGEKATWRFKTSEGEKSFTMGDWEEIDPDQLEKIATLLAVSTISGTGCLTAFYWIVAVGSMFGWFVSAADASFQMGTVIFPSLAAFFFPMAAGGNVSAWKPEGLDMKLSVLRNILPALRDTEGLSVKIQAKYYNEIKGANKIPYDLQAKANYENAPKELYGVQFQVSVNKVQSSSFPYYYAVIVADRNFYLKQKMAGARAPGKEITEYKEEKDVSIIVVRQDPASKTTGYFTNPADQIRITANALNLFERLRPK